MSFFRICKILLNSVFFTITHKIVHIFSYSIKNIACVQCDESASHRQVSLRQCGRDMPSNGAHFIVQSFIRSLMGVHHRRKPPQQNNLIISTNSVFSSFSILSIHSSIVSFNFVSLSSISTLLIFESGLKRMNIHFPL